MVVGNRFCVRWSWIWSGLVYEAGRCLRAVNVLRTVDSRDELTSVAAGTGPDGPSRVPSRVPRETGLGVNTSGGRCKATNPVKISGCESGEVEKSAVQALPVPGAPSQSENGGQLPLAGP